MLLVPNLHHTLCPVQATRWKSGPSQAFSRQCSGHHHSDRLSKQDGILPFCSLRDLLLRPSDKTEYQNNHLLSRRRLLTCWSKKREGDNKGKRCSYYNPWKKAITVTYSESRRWAKGDGKSTRASMWTWTTAWRLNFLPWYAWYSVYMIARILYIETVNMAFKK